MKKNKLQKTIFLCKRKIQNRFQIYKDIRTMSKKLEQQGVFFLYFEPPRHDKIKNLSSFEKERIKNWTFNFNNVKSNQSDLKKIQMIYGDDFDIELLQDLYDGAKVINRGDRKIVVDFSSKYVNIVGGMRLTTNQPEKYYNKIHLYGACTIRGNGVKDSETIASFLQNILNKKLKNTYQVLNHGIGCGSTLHDDLASINQTPLHKGDIVILCNYVDNQFANYCTKNAISYFECSSVFHRPHLLGEWFTDDTNHTNHIGNQAIAEYMFKILSEKGYLNIERSQCKNDETVILSNSASIFENNEELKEYLRYLKTQKVNLKNSSLVGAIVMNCNPFTLGHRYLIEQAARQIDELYIFVVEENKSYFDFQDRFDLVKQGTKDLKNVYVIPSGKFIISAQTFPGYFYKDDLKDTVVDSSQDIDIFGKYIAPVLNIKIRFAGEEPLDPVTNQYNTTMKERLPLYGIEFRVIPRKESGDEVISASRVRRYLESGELEKIKSLVPVTTFEYLLEKYGKGKEHD